MIWHAYMIEAPAFGRYREFEVAHAMEALGGAAIVPYEVERHRKRSAAGYGLRRIPIIPGYVFAGFAAVHPYAAIKKLDHLIGAVSATREGPPLMLSRRDLAALMAIRSGQERVAQTAKAIGKGDRIRVLDEIVVVKNVVKGKFIIEKDMLGGKREIAIDASRVERVA